MTSNPAPLPGDIPQVVELALREDVGDGDVTASLIDAARQARAEVVCREDAVLAGAPWFDQVFAQIDPAVHINWLFRDGERIAPDTVVCELRGAANSIVTGERTALNFLQTLSATATVTRRYADALAGSKTRVLDTRKTIPGLRAAQKYAVRCGGGENHRMGLYDAVLIKENHIAAAGTIGAAVKTIRQRHPGLKVEVEVESLAELEQALAAGVDMVLLDNFSFEAMQQATALVNGRVVVEISGGVAFDQIPMLAQAGADFVSVGALTKHIRAIDFSMRITD